MFYYKTNDDLNFPCVALSISSFLDEYQIDCKDKQVVILGKSYLVGHPTFTLFESKGARVIMEDEFNQSLSEKIKTADIVVAALGRGKILSAGDVKTDAIVFDVGIRLEDCQSNSNLSGDTDYKAVGLLVDGNRELRYSGSRRHWTVDRGLDAAQLIPVL